VRSDSTEADDGSVHPLAGSDGADTLNESPSDEPYTGKPSGEGFGREGWILVAGVVLCFLVIPGFIYLNPTAPAQIGWTFFATFLVLPLIPAVLLGLLAVWSMQAAA